MMKAERGNQVKSIRTTSELYLESFSTHSRKHEGWRKNPSTRAKDEGVEETSASNWIIGISIGSRLKLKI